MLELPANLTPRESDVIALYSQGITKAREIAKELSISNVRVTQLLNKAFDKMGHESARKLRVDAYVKAVRRWRSSPDGATPEGFDAILPSEYSSMPEDIWDYFLDSPVRRQYFASLEEADFAALPTRARVSLRNLRERLSKIWFA